MINSIQRTKVIVRYGIGVDNINIEAARAKNIPVCNVPDYCIDEVADQTLAFILAATRSVVANSIAVHEGRWGLATPLEQMRTLRDLQVGVVGFGRIGREVVHRLLSFKCRVLVHDPVVAVEEISRAGSLPARLTTCCAKQIFITLHCPSTAATRGLINAESIARMKPGVILINVARGDLIDPAALTAALGSGHVSLAALDVFAPSRFRPTTRFCGPAMRSSRAVSPRRPGARVPCVKRQPESWRRPFAVSPCRISSMA